MMFVQEYLRTHSLQELETEHGVNARYSNDCSKFSLNYDQLAAKSDNPIACQCRGLVLRPTAGPRLTFEPVGETTVVARPLDRFFNAGDVHAAPIDWDTAVIQSKLDGTMTELYWDSVKEQWCVATRSVPEADASFGDPPGSPLKENTFYELFMYAAARSHSPYFTDLDHWLTVMQQERDKTFIFELTSPLNRVVVKYDDYRITILAARETANGKYLPTNELYKIGVPVVETWPLKTLADIEHFLHDSDPAKIEGAVVIDANHNRIKVKSKQWILASRAKDLVTMSKRNALECIIDGSSDDVIPLLSEELQDYMHKLQSGLVEYCRQLDVAFNTYRLTSTDRKQFALFVQASGFWQSPFFALYDGKWKTTLEWLRGLSTTKKLTDTALDVLLGNIKVKA